MSKRSEGEHPWHACPLLCAPSLLASVRTAARRVPPRALDIYSQARVPRAAGNHPIRRAGSEGRGGRAPHLALGELAEHNDLVQAVQELGPAGGEGRGGGTARELEGPKEVVDVLLAAASAHAAPASGAGASCDRPDCRACGPPSPPCGQHSVPSAPPPEVLLQLLVHQRLDAVVAAVLLVGVLGGGGDEGGFRISPSAQHFGGCWLPRKCWGASAQLQHAAAQRLAEQGNRRRCWRECPRMLAGAPQGQPSASRPSPAQLSPSSAPPRPAHQLEADAAAALLDDGGAHVGGEDDERVLEVHGAALGVGQAAQREGRGAAGAGAGVGG